MADERILIWLPSPLGDAIMATPALRALRRHFAGNRIFFFGSAAVREVLSPSVFCDGWIEQQAGLWNHLSSLKDSGSRLCILLKNSFGSALTAWLARIPRRIGYAREGRRRMLTDSLRPPADANGRYTPIPAIDYYLRIAHFLGADISDRTMELSVAETDRGSLQQKLPAVFEHPGPLVILVPGGAFGPSKCWPSERFAQVADRLIEKYKAAVVLSVAPTRQEKEIADQIRQHADHPLINLGDRPLGLGALKALLGRADLVITNDTGPRHIAIALRRKVVTLFGPNNPQWTQTGYGDEIQIVGTGPCVPCDRPVCEQTQHYCMDSISVEQVLEAADQFLSEAAV